MLRPFQCEWSMWGAPTTTKTRSGRAVTYRPFRGDCAISPVVAIVDFNLLGTGRRMPSTIGVCARHARVYFHTLNRRRGNAQYLPFVRRQGREQARQRAQEAGNG